LWKINYLLSGVMVIVVDCGFRAFLVRIEPKATKLLLGFARCI